MSWGTAVASIWSSYQQSQAMKDAAQTQANAANMAGQMGQNQFNQTMAMQRPYLRGGANSLAQLQYLLGMEPTAYADAQKAFGDNGMGSGQIGEGANLTSGAYNNIQDFAAKGGDPALVARMLDRYREWDAQDAAKAQAAQATQPQTDPYAGFKPTGQFGELNRKFGMSDFQEDPGYAFRMSEAQKALEKSAAARGGLLSGGTLKGVTDLSQNLASQEYQNSYNRFSNDQTSRFNRLAALAGIGQTATNITGQLGAHNAASMGDYATQAANAAAAGRMGQAGAWNQGIQGAINGISNYNQWNDLMGSQGGNRPMMSYEDMLSRAQSGSTFNNVEG
jgi:hypothetical protein